jgi:asparagine synthase (glutamine-hydrolysing)
MIESLDGHVAWEDLELNRDRMRRWHPLNRSIYLGYKTILPGLLMNHKGDRVAMASAVETRYPFLDEEVIALCARISPRFKLRGALRDKWVLREMAAEFLPRRISRRPKMMFRAPFGATFFADPPAYVSQLLRRESLAAGGYFDPDKVEASLGEYRRSFLPPGRRVFVEMGLAAVLATQLWHHLYMGRALCELPR